MSKKQTETKTSAKSVSITLRAANGAVMTLLGVRQENGSVITTVTTRNPSEKPVRGMTETLKNIDAARTHLEALAKSAIALGWKRGTFAAGRPADQFSKLPSAPKPVQPEA